MNTANMESIQPILEAAAQATSAIKKIGSAQKGVLQMKGNALSYPELVSFLGKMEQDKIFVEATLLKAEQNEKDALTRFEITAKVRGQ